MPQKNLFSDFFSQHDFGKLFEAYKNPALDMQSFLETQRKNLQALGHAQQLTLESLQTIAERQSEILSQMVEDNASLAREMMAEGTPEEKIARNAEIFKNVYARTVANMKDLSEIINKSSHDATNVINKRVTATMSEIQESLEKAQEKAQEKSQQKTSKKAA
jgi:phasin family protein